MTIQGIRKAVAAPTPPLARRDPKEVKRRPPSLGADQFVRTAPSPGTSTAAGREALTAQLVAASDRLLWETNPSEKVRLLSTVARLRTDAGADFVKKSYVDGIGKLSPPRQEALARVFQSLLAASPLPGTAALSPAKHAELVDFVCKEFETGGRNADVRQQLGYVLGSSQTEIGADAIIKEYRAHPATGGMAVHRGLFLLSYCPMEKVSAFLATEYERLAGNEAARQQVLEALQEQVMIVMP